MNIFKGVYLLFVNKMEHAEKFIFIIQWMYGH